MVLYAVAGVLWWVVVDVLWCEGDGCGDSGWRWVVGGLWVVGGCVGGEWLW